MQVQRALQYKALPVFKEQKKCSVRYHGGENDHDWVSGKSSIAHVEGSSITKTGTSKHS